MENRALKKELAKLESREKYEEKYLQAEKEIEQLKKELENITRNSLDLGECKIKCVS